MVGATFFDPQQIQPFFVDNLQELWLIRSERKKKVHFLNVRSQRNLCLIPPFFFFCIHFISRTFFFFFLFSFFPSNCSLRHLLLGNVFPPNWLSTNRLTSQLPYFAFVKRGPEILLRFPRGPDINKSYSVVFNAENFYPFNILPAIISAIIKQYFCLFHSCPVQ